MNYGLLIILFLLFLSKPKAFLAVGTVVGVLSILFLSMYINAH